MITLVGVRGPAFEFEISSGGVTPSDVPFETFILGWRLDTAFVAGWQLNTAFVTGWQLDTAVVLGWRSGVAFYFGVTAYVGDALLLTFPRYGVNPNWIAPTFDFELRATAGDAAQVQGYPKQGATIDGAGNITLTLSAADTTLPPGTYDAVLRHTNVGGEGTIAKGTIQLDAR